MTIITDVFTVIKFCSPYHYTSRYTMSGIGMNIKITSYKQSSIRPLKFKDTNGARLHHKSKSD